MVKNQFSASNSIIEYVDKIEKSSSFGTWLISELIEILTINKPMAIISSTISPLRREGEKLGIKDPFSSLSPLLWARKIKQELLETKLMPNA